MQSHKIKLLSFTYISDAIGNQIPQESAAEVWAEEVSIRQSEFYSAAVAGLRPEKTFIVWANEYRGQTKIEADGIRYKLIRTYTSPAKSEMIELVCEREVACG